MKYLFFVTVGVFLLSSIFFNLLGITFFNQEIAIQPLDQVVCNVENAIITWEVISVHHNYSVFSGWTFKYTFIDLTGAICANYGSGQYACNNDYIYYSKCKK